VVGDARDALGQLFLVLTFLGLRQHVEQGAGGYRCAHPGQRFGGPQPGLSVTFCYEFEQGLDGVVAHRDQFIQAALDRGLIIVVRGASQGGDHPGGAFDRRRVASWGNGTLGPRVVGRISRLVGSCQGRRQGRAVAFVFDRGSPQGGRLRPAASCGGVRRRLPRSETRRQISLERVIDAVQDAQGDQDHDGKCQQRPLKLDASIPLVGRCRF